jgi:hypothetical protein
MSSSRNPRFLELIQNRKGNLWIWVKPLLGMYSLCWGNPWVQIPSILVPRSSRIKCGKKDLNFGKFFVWTEQIQWTFSRNIWSLFWAWFANRKSDWSHSSTVSFVIWSESCFFYWKVLSSHSSIGVVQGFEFGTLTDSCKEFCWAPIHPSSGHPLGPLIGIRAS